MIVEMRKASCSCEYPCSCVTWRGETFPSPSDLVDHLSKQLDDANNEIYMNTQSENMRSE